MKEQKLNLRKMPSIISTSSKETLDVDDAGKKVQSFSLIPSMLHYMESECPTDLGCFGNLEEIQLPKSRMPLLSSSNINDCNDISYGVSNAVSSSNGVDRNMDCNEVVGLIIKL
ncbi:hypothetical protein LIER_02264 [Lithospermum erythrorhizon]|uniref:Uncharacterized protein n=1 Tax=Lithospermum erythrorhizon TaxID=34254 RepID=A0AAV3NQC7_LITER